MGPSLNPRTPEQGLCRISKIPTGTHSSHLPEGTLSFEMNQAPRGCFKVLNPFDCVPALPCLQAQSLPQTNDKVLKRRKRKGRKEKIKIKSMGVERGKVWCVNLYIKRAKPLNGIPCPCSSPDVPEACTGSTHSCRDQSPCEHKSRQLPMEEEKGGEGAI